MIHIRREGGTVRTGFNFYPLNDPSSAGFLFKLIGRIVCVRYSKLAKKWKVSYHTS